ncbi:MAG TPA: sugar ABC transporter permease [Treponema sp.]|nr:sugar ABC transporter permease [Treponema sp.]
MNSSKKIFNIFIYIIAIVFALITFMPVLFLIINSFKSQAEIIRNPLALPTHFTFEYLKNAFVKIHFLRALGNTLFVTILSLFLIVFTSAPAGWMIARNKTKASQIVYLIFASSILIPFQSLMYPLLKMIDSLGLKNMVGLSFMYVGFGLAMSVFLYAGFFKSIPFSIEESAIVDGANVFQIFIKIVFPLVLPTTITVLIINGMWIWNDYLLPFLTLGTSKAKTLVLELYYARMLAGQYGNPWELIFPAVFLVVMPMIILFLFLQRYFVEGATSGSVKE